MSPDKFGPVVTNLVSERDVDHRFYVYVRGKSRCAVSMAVSLTVLFTYLSENLSIWCRTSSPTRSEKQLAGVATL